MEVGRGGQGEGRGRKVLSKLFTYASKFADYAVPMGGTASKQCSTET